VRKIYLINVNILGWIITW